MLKSRYTGDDAKIDRQVRRGNYERAVELLEKALEEEPSSARLKQKLADVLARSGERERAADIFCQLAEAFARDGFTAKAIATLKRVQRVDRRRPRAEVRLAELILRRSQELSTAPSTEVAADSSATLPVHSQLFDGIDTNELVAAIGGFTLETFSAGDVVFSEGQPGDGIYVLASGTAKVFVRDASGRNRAVRTLGNGDFFGEIATLTGGPRTATVTAAGDCEVLRLEQATVDTLAEKFPRIPEIVVKFGALRSGSSAELKAREVESDLPGAGSDLPSSAGS